jgi:hypothetical protein
MKYEVTNWLNTDTISVVYGIIAKMDGGKKYNVADGDNKPMFFESEAEAKDMVDQLNSLPRCGICGKPLTAAMRQVHDEDLGICCAEHYDNE